MTCDGCSRRACPGAASCKFPGSCWTTRRTRARTRSGSPGGGGNAVAGSTCPVGCCMHRLPHALPSTPMHARRGRRVPSAVLDTRRSTGGKNAATRSAACSIFACPRELTRDALQRGAALGIPASQRPSHRAAASLRSPPTARHPRAPVPTHLSPHTQSTGGDTLLPLAAVAPAPHRPQKA
jgi:hypothetical protein